MSERTAQDLPEPYSGAWLRAPWPLLREVSATLPPASWTLVGGLMVQTHAHLSGLAATRITHDVDTVLHLETGATSFSEVHRLLVARGFMLETEHRHAYRFARGRDVVDVMAADRFVASRAPVYRRRPLLGIPGSTRALSRTLNITLRDANDAGVGTFSLPSLQGAFVLKGAACLVDHRDSARHVEDGITLLACVTDAREIRAGLTRRSRRRVRALLRAVALDREPWLTQSRDTQDRARINLGVMEAAFDVNGNDNSWVRGS
ncbi:hypothetical protein AUL38_07835 [Leucobacter sp. G161]|nr:hypothetical protein AUL38_07835 [Leucobacter sp. G161]